MRWWKQVGLKADNLRLRPHGADELAHLFGRLLRRRIHFPLGLGRARGHRLAHRLRPQGAHRGLGQEADLLRPRGRRPGDRQKRLALHAARGRARRRRHARRAGPPVRRLRRRARRRRRQRRTHGAAPPPAPRADQGGGAAAGQERRHARKGPRDRRNAFFDAGINAKFDEQHAIGKRYARHDEIGTPYCLTVDGETAGDDTVTIRYRDDRRQERIKVAEAVEVVRKAWRPVGGEARSRQPAHR